MRVILVSGNKTKIIKTGKFLLNILVCVWGSRIGDVNVP